MLQVTWTRGSKSINVLMLGYSPHATTETNNMNTTRHGGIKLKMRNTNTMNDELSNVLESASVEIVGS